MMNTEDQKLRETKRVCLVIFTAVIVFATYQTVINNKIMAKGVYSKCTLVDAEGRKGGIMITIKYKYLGKDHEGRLGSTLGKRSIGKQYFVKLLPEYPDYPVFLKDNPVPECLSAIDPPPEGWKKLPECK